MGRKMKVVQIGLASANPGAASACDVDRCVRVRLIEVSRNRRVARIELAVRSSRLARACEVKGRAGCNISLKLAKMKVIQIGLASMELGIVRKGRRSERMRV